MFNPGHNAIASPSNAMPVRAFCLPRLLGVFGLAVMVWLAGCNAAAPASDAPLIQSMAWSIDDTGQATWPEMQARTDWQAFDGSHNWGFGSAAIWVRYTLRAGSPEETTPWILQIRPAFQQNLTLYDPASGLQKPLGHSAVPADNSLGTLHHTFQIPAQPYERQVYLRLQSERTRILVTDVLPMREAIAQSQSEEWLMGFLVSISCMFAVWASTQWLLTREAVMGAFALKQWLATLWAFNNMGFMRVLLGNRVAPELLSTVEPFIRIWTLAGTMWFLLMLTREYQPDRRWVKACGVGIASVVVLPFLQFAGWAMPMGVIANIFVLLGLMLIWVTLLSSPAAQAQAQPAIPRRFLVVYFLLYALVNSVPSSMYLGWLPLHPIAIKANLSHMLLDGLVMFLLLQLRARHMTLQAQRMAEQHLHITRKLDRAQQTMEFEQRRRQEQSQFLHMLMHELKTPLSIVSLALSDRLRREENLTHASRAVQDMKAIIERCVQSDQLGELQLERHCQTVDVHRLLHEQVQTLPELQSRLHLLSSDHLPWLHTDPQLLQIILTNLLDNAAHYSDPHTPVTVRLDPAAHGEQEGLHVRVSNTPGLAGWPDPERVFSKYYRASGAQRESGTGLGLYLSRQLAQSLGGTLNYEPGNQHVEFVLWIPLHPA